MVPSRPASGSGLLGGFAALVASLGPYQILRTVAGGDHGFLEALAILSAAALAAGSLARPAWASLGRTMRAYAAGALAGVGLAWLADAWTGQAADLEILGVIVALYPLGAVVAALGISWGILGRRLAAASVSPLLASALALPLPLLVAVGPAHLLAEGHAAAALLGLVAMAGAGWLARWSGRWAPPLRWSRRPTGDWVAYAADLVLLGALLGLATAFPLDRTEGAPALALVYAAGAVAFAAAASLPLGQLRGFSD